MKHSLKYGIAGLLCILLAACGGEDTSNEQTTTDQPGATTENRGVVDITYTAEQEIDGVAFGDIYIGDPNAPVTVIEYASLTCGACANFHANVWPEFKERFIETGQVYFIFRNFTRQAQDTMAAMISRCAGTERVFPMMELMFARQRDWLTADPTEELASMARRVGMNRAAFDACLANSELQADILEMRQEGIDDFDISATPTFLIGDERVEGVIPVEDFADIIRDAR